MTRRIWFFSTLSLDAAAALATSTADDDVTALAWLLFEARHLCDDAPPEIEP